MLARSEFIDAALASGCRTQGDAFWRHIVPHLAGRSSPTRRLTIPQMILFESLFELSRSWRQEPFASLGSLINDGAQEMESSPWMLLVLATFLRSMLYTLAISIASATHCACRSSAR